MISAMERDTLEDRIAVFTRRRDQLERAIRRVGYAPRRVQLRDERERVAAEIRSCRARLTEGVT